MKEVHRKGPKWKTSNPIINPLLPLSEGSNCGDVSATDPPLWVASQPNELMDDLILDGFRASPEDGLFNALDYTSFLWGTSLSLDLGPVSAINDPADSNIPPDILPKGSECVVSAAVGESY